MARIASGNITFQIVENGTDGVDALPDFGAGLIGGTGDFTFTLNQLGGGTANDGELRIQATTFNHPNGTTVAISPTDGSLHSSYGEGDSGTYYVMYTSQSRATRFSTIDNPGNLTQFVNVRQITGGSWVAFGNGFTPSITFTPLATDVLVASVSAAATTGGLTSRVPYVGTNGADGGTGATGPRRTTGTVYFATAQTAVPSAPSATSYNFSTGAFTSLTTDWSTSKPVTVASSTLLYWQSTYEMSEATFGGTQTRTFNTPTSIASFENLLVSGELITEDIKGGTKESSNDLTNTGYYLDSEGSAIFGGGGVGSNLRIEDDGSLLQIEPYRVFYNVRLTGNFTFTDGRWGMKTTATESSTSRRIQSSTNSADTFSTSVKQIIFNKDDTEIGDQSTVLYDQLILNLAASKTVRCRVMREDPDKNEEIADFTVSSIKRVDKDGNVTSSGDYYWMLISEITVSGSPTSINQANTNVVSFSWNYFPDTESGIKLYNIDGGQSYLSNTAVGDGARAYGISDNTAFGSEALSNSNLFTRSVTAIGSNSLAALAPSASSGDSNTAVGYNSGSSLTKGADNTLIGARAGEFINSTSTAQAHSNTCIGFESGLDVGTSSSNITTGIENVCVGYKSSTVTSNSEGAVSIGRSTRCASEAVAIGPGAFAEGLHSVAVGDQANSGGANSIAIGGSTGNNNGARASGVDAIAIGQESDATGANSIAIGGAVGDVNGAQATADRSTALGNGTDATGSNSTALGNGAQATAINATALGNVAVSSGSNSTAIGNATDATQTGSVAVGDGAQATGTVGSVAIGDGAVSSGTSSVSLGNSAQATGTDTTSVGNGAVSSSTSATSIGANTDSTGLASIAIGAGIGSNPGAQATGGLSIAIGGSFFGQCQATQDNAIAIGSNAEATGNSAVAIGNGTDATQTGAIAIGDGAQGTGTVGSVAIGDGAVSSGTSSVSLGNATDATQTGAIAIGDGAQARATDTIAIGNGAGSTTQTSAGADTICIGADSGSSLTTGNNNTLIGQNAGNTITTGSNNVIIGKDSDTTANVGSSSVNNSVAIGIGALTTGLGSIAMGNGSQSTGGFSVAIGSNFFGSIKASGSTSTAIGFEAQATATDSTAIGSGTGATATNATALGTGAQATGVNSTAIGNGAVTGGSDVEFFPSNLDTGGIGGFETWKMSTSNTATTIIDSLVGTTTLNDQIVVLAFNNRSAVSLTDVNTDSDSVSGIKLATMEQIRAGDTFIMTIPSDNNTEITSQGTVEFTITADPEYQRDNSVTASPTTNSEFWRVPVSVTAAAINNLPGVSDGNVSLNFNADNPVSFRFTGIDIDNRVALGNSDVVNLACNVQTISSLSDQRDKSNITDLSEADGLPFINALQPRTYYWDRREWYDDGVPDGTKVMMEKSSKPNSGKQMGFIAQETEVAMEGLTCISDSNLVTGDSYQKKMAYGELITPLVKAVQQLSAQVDALTARIEDLENPTP